jgi:hypothetical protein
MNFLKGLKAGTKSLFSKEQPSCYAVAGRRVACPHCGNEEFYPRRASVHGAASSFFSTEWASPRAHLLVCAQCTRIEWFFEQPQEC